MRQMNWVSQFLTKRKFIPFLAVVCLLVPTVACAQVIEPPEQQAETAPMPLWPEQPEQNKATPQERQGPPAGTVITMQKQVKCNDTPVIKNYVQVTGGMTPVTFGTNLNEMGAIVSLIQLYANPVNKRFAIIEHFAHQKSCILTHGSDFEIILPPLPQEVPN